MPLGKCHAPRQVIVRYYIRNVYELGKFVTVMFVTNNDVRRILMLINIMHKCLIETDVGSVVHVNVNKHMMYNV